MSARISRQGSQSPQKTKARKCAEPPGDACLNTVTLSHGLMNNPGQHIFRQPAGKSDEQLPNCRNLNDLRCGGHCRRGPLALHRVARPVERRLSRPSTWTHDPAWAKQPSPLRIAVVRPENHAKPSNVTGTRGAGPKSGFAVLGWAGTLFRPSNPVVRMEAAFTPRSGGA
jgi:hypothetical protein